MPLNPYIIYGNKKIINEFIGPSSFMGDNKVQVGGME